MPTSDRNGRNAFFGHDTDSPGLMLAGGDTCFADSFLPGLGFRVSCMRQFALSESSRFN